MSETLNGLPVRISNIEDCLTKEREDEYRMYHVSGHHHISMMTKNAQVNNHFYQKVLGLRRVKVSVNQDDPTMYHIFYGDRTGTPGTELTFFEMPNIGQTHRGTNAITQIGLLVPSEESLEFWKERLDQYEIQHGDMITYANRVAIHLEDPDGLRLVLLAADGEKVAGWEAWEKSAVPIKHQIQGMGPVEMTVRRLNKLARTLTELFNYTEIARTERKAVFQSIHGEVFGEVIVKELDGEKEKPGQGSVHHLAIRAKDDAELAYWNEQVRKRGFESTGIIDRFYFKSFYFRESNGIVFEVATDGPGFTVDGNVDTLGEKLDLPPLLEGRRTEIEASLHPIDEK